MQVGLDCVEIVDDRRYVILAGRVSPQHQHKGISNAIVLAATQWAKARLTDGLCLGTAVYNPKLHDNPPKYINMRVNRKWVRNKMYTCTHDFYTALLFIS